MSPAGPYSKSAGCNTRVGHAVTHRPQAVHCLRKRSTRREPGGLTGGGFSGTGGLALAVTGAVGVPAARSAEGAQPFHPIRASNRSRKWRRELPWHVAGSTGGEGRARRRQASSKCTPRSGQTPRQLKQRTQREKSSSCRRRSMHWALQTSKHSPHLRQRPGLSRNRHRARRANQPSRVPTGQIVLQ